MDKQMTELSTRLARKYMLGRVCVHQWSGEIYDRAESDRLAEVRKAKKGRAKVTKDLIATEYAPVKKKLGEARTFVRRNSYRYADMSGSVGESWNIFTVDVLREIIRPRLAEIVREARTLILEFVEAYPGYVERDMRDLGELAKSGDYPSQNELAQKFAVGEPFPIDANGDVVIDPDRLGVVWYQQAVPTASMIQVDDESLSAMVSDAVARDRLLVENMNKETWNRIETPLRHFAETMAKVNSGEIAFVKQATHEHLADVVRLMRGFNVTNDTNVENCLTEIENLYSMTEYTVKGKTHEGLKNNARTRAEAGEIANDILKRYADRFTGGA